jgi:hypothetical protein
MADYELTYTPEGLPFYRGRVFARDIMLHDNKRFRLGDFITPAMRSQAATMTKMNWLYPFKDTLDQGQTPHCVGYGWAHWGITSPVNDVWSNSDGERIYYAAKIIDGEPGQENGSNTESAAKVMLNTGRLKVYAFATNWNDIETWLLVNGPVMVGTNWYEQMSDPDAQGIVHIGGSVAGGHEYCVNGIDTEARLTDDLQSWGPWGPLNGRFHQTFDDFNELQSESGDCCVAVELALGPTPPTPPTPPGDGCAVLAKMLGQATKDPYLAQNKKFVAGAQAFIKKLS